ncbi:MAG: molecular chaperone DnaJ [Acidobacteria bacterium]|nr:MAG: molecular chaperone DnaJ [Acidobacteriota bacterium]
MKTVTDTAAGFQDHYETLQLSPRADADTVERVFRILVKRYHPDNQETGNLEKFGHVMEAHRVLEDPEKRAAYDVRYDENRSHVLKIFDEASAGESFEGDRRILEGVLSVLYISRRRDAARGGMGTMQLEQLLGCPAEHLEFHMWYLRQKGWIERLDNGHLAITASGVDHVIEQDNIILRRDRLLAERNTPEAPSSSSSRQRDLDLLT